MTKKEARSYFLELRKQLNPLSYNKLNAELLNQVKKHCSWEGKLIATFLSMENKLELDTSLINSWLMEKNELFAPVSNFETLEMDFLSYRKETTVALNSYGIPEPLEGEIMEPSKINIVLTPLLAYDRNGYRAGYGKGFYDRFSEQTNPETKFIGLSLFDPIDTITDINIWDKRLNNCITPKGFYSFD